MASNTAPKWPRVSLEDLSKEEEEDVVPRQARARSTGAQKKPGKAWSEMEHMAFLRGLEDLGHGKWKQIAEEYVKTRDHTQVASHAQKHVIRRRGTPKRRSRFHEYEEKAQAAHTLQALPSNRAESPWPSPANQPADLLSGVRDAATQTSTSVFHSNEGEIDTAQQLSPSQDPHRIFRPMPVRAFPSSQTTMSSEPGWMDGDN